MSESFEKVYDRVYPQLHNPCGMWKAGVVKEWLDELMTAHEHEIEHLRKAEFHRGYVAGQRSMDAEHRAVAMRLRALPLDEDSHGNLSQIARAIWHSDFGWTRGACEALRDKIIELLGGVHGDIDVPNLGNGNACGDCDCGGGEQPQVVTYDELGNERHEAVCRLREWSPDEDGRTYREFWEAVMGERLPTVPLKGDAELDIIMRDRLIHLLGGDEPTAMEYIQRIVREHDIKCLDMELSGAKLSQASVEAMSRRADESHESSPTSLENETGITDELRKWMDKFRLDNHLEWWRLDYTSYEELVSIADRIDEQFKRLCWQQEAVLQKTIDTMVDGREELQSELEKCKELYEQYRTSYLNCVADYNAMLMERDDLKRKLERSSAEYRETCEEAETTDILRAKLDAVREALDG